MKMSDSGLIYYFTQECARITNKTLKKKDQLPSASYKR